jgi:hypothetical protein
MSANEALPNPSVDPGVERVNTIGKLITSLLLIITAFLFVYQKSVSNSLIIVIFLTVGFAFSFLRSDIDAYLSSPPAIVENAHAETKKPLTFKGPLDPSVATKESWKKIQSKIDGMNGSAHVLVIGNSTENAVRDIVNWNKGGTTLVVLPESLASTRFIESNTSVSSNHFVTSKFYRHSPEQLKDILESPSRWQLLTPENIPEEVKDHTWDVIVVDLSGVENESVAVQGLYLAKLVMKGGTDVFVPDAHNYTTQMAMQSFFSFIV